MGSAIESFDDSGAVVVPRSRFAPVKTTNDLFVLRSDAYNVRGRQQTIGYICHCALHNVAPNPRERRSWSSLICTAFSHSVTAPRKGCSLRVH